MKKIIDFLNTRNGFYIIKYGFFVILLSAPLLMTDFKNYPLEGLLTLFLWWCGIIFLLLFHSIESRGDRIKELEEENEKLKLELNKK